MIAIRCIYPLVEYFIYKSDPNSGILQLVQIVESKNNLFANTVNDEQRNLFSIS